MTEQQILAIDLGTSGPKVTLVSPSGGISGGAFVPVGLRLLPGGGAEQDPDEWWRATTAAVRRVLDAQPEAASAVAGVGVTAQWSGTVPIGADGHHLCDAIVWMDSRGAGHIERLITGPVRVSGYSVSKAARWIRLTGGAPARSGKDPLAHILWLREERPDIYQATRVFLEPKDYLNYRLTGRAVATFDSISLHWVTDNRDLQTIDYDAGLLAMAGIDRSKLPELLPATGVVGGLSADAAADLGLPPGTPVIGGTPDLHSSAVGSGAVDDFAAHLYIGTSAWLSCHVPFKKTDLLHNIASLPAPVPGRYFVANEQETAGACLDRLARMLGGPEAGSDYPALDEIAERTPPGAGGVVFAPWLNGERTPVEDSGLRGSFVNISLGTDRDHLVRAVFEGVAFNARWLLEAVERFTRRRLDPIVMVGGGANSAVWCRIHADVLDRTILQAADPIWVNARGVGLLAAASLELIPWEDVGSSVPIAATHRPDRSQRALYDRHYRVFRRLHRATRSLKTD